MVDTEGRELLWRHDLQRNTMLHAVSTRLIVDDNEDGNRAARYAQSLDAHRQIEVLYQRVNATKAYFRNPHAVSPGVPLPPGTQSRVDTDRVFCALANKAATTKESIARLCQAGDGRNALVLARVLLENACLIEWLGRDPRRLETYVLFRSVKHERSVQTLKYFYERLSRGEPRVTSNPYDRAIAEHVFQGKHDTWAYFPHPTKLGELERVTVRRMFEEVTGNNRPQEYEVWYAMGSDEIHSAVLSLGHLIAASGDTFVLQSSPSGEASLIALAISNIAMLLVLDAVNEYAALGLGDEIAAIKDFTRRGDDPL